jgi:hypothetical protein
MPNNHVAPAAGNAGGFAVDRRTLLVGAAGTLAVAGLSGPAGAMGRAASVASGSARRFDPALARQLQKVLRTALADPAVWRRRWRCVPVTAAGREAS